MHNHGAVVVKTRTGEASVSDKRLKGIRSGISTLVQLISSRAARSVIDQGAISVASFLTMVVLGRYAGEIELGRYALAFTTLWLSASIPNTLVWIQFAIRSPKLSGVRSRRYERSVACHIILFSAFMVIPVSSISWALSNPSPILFVSMYTFVVGNFLREHIRRVFMSKMDLWSLLWIDLVTSALQLLALLIFVQTSSLSSAGIMLAHGLILLVPALYVLAKLQIQNAHAKEVWIDFLRNWRSGKWLVSASMIGAACDAMVRFAIVSIMGVFELGRFTAAFSLPLVVNPLMLTLSNWLRVSVARQAAACDEGQVVVRTIRLIGYFAVFGVSVFGCIAAFGEQAANAMYGKRFMGLGMTIAFVCGGLAISMASIPAEIALATTGRVRSIMFANILRFICMTIVVWPLVSIFGLVGGGLTLVIGYLAAFAVQFFQLRQLLPEQTRKAV